MSDNNILLEVQGLKKAFGDNKVLDGITTDIRQGEVVAVIGPSGSGKSTFLRSLNLLEVPTGGRILFEGTDITRKWTSTVTAKKLAWYSSSLICFQT